MQNGASTIATVDSATIMQVHSFHILSCHGCLHFSRHTISGTQVLHTQYGLLQGSKQPLTPAISAFSSLSH